MNMDNLTKWLSLVANFGVVAGIIFLAIEVRQNQTGLEQNQALMERDYELQTIEGHQQIADSNDELRLLLAGNEGAAKIWFDGIYGNEQTILEKQRFLGLCDLAVWNDAVSHRRTLALARPEEAKFLEIAFRSKIESWPGFRECWNKNKGALRSWGYGHLVDGVEAAEFTKRQDATP